MNFKVTGIIVGISIAVILICTILIPMVTNMSTDTYADNPDSDLSAKHYAMGWYSITYPDITSSSFIFKDNDREIQSSGLEHIIVGKEMICSVNIKDDMSKLTITTQNGVRNTLDKTIDTTVLNSHIKITFERTMLKIELPTDGQMRTYSFKVGENYLFNDYIKDSEFNVYIGDIDGKFYTGKNDYYTAITKFGGSVFKGTLKWYGSGTAYQNENEQISYDIYEYENGTPVEVV